MYSRASSKLILDDFPFGGFSVAHLEPKLEFFEVDDNDDDVDENLWHHYCHQLQTVNGVKSTLIS